MPRLQNIDCQQNMRENERREDAKRFRPSCRPQICSCAFRIRTICYVIQNKFGRCCTHQEVCSEIFFEEVKSTNLYYACTLSSLLRFVLEGLVAVLRVSR